MTCALRKNSGWVLKCRKVAVLHGATADEFIVSAQTVAGLSLFLVPASASGLRIVEQRGYDGIPIAEIALDDVTVPADSLLGGAGSGAGVLERVFEAAHAALAAEGVGIMAERPDHHRTGERREGKEWVRKW